MAVFGGAVVGLDRGVVERGSRAPRARGSWHPHAGIAELAAQRFGEAVQADLARAVDAESRQADAAERRADEDRPARAAGAAAAAAPAGSAASARADWCEARRRGREGGSASQRPKPGTPAAWMTHVGAPGLGCGGDVRPAPCVVGSGRPVPSACRRRRSRGRPGGARRRPSPRRRRRSVRRAIAWPMPPRRRSGARAGVGGLHAASPRCVGQATRSWPAAAAGCGTHRHRDGRTARAACTMAAWSRGSVDPVHQQREVRGVLAGRACRATQVAERGVGQRRAASGSRRPPAGPATRWCLRAHAPCRRSRAGCAARSCRRHRPP